MAFLPVPEISATLLSDNPAISADDRVVRTLQSAFTNFEYFSLHAGARTSATSAMMLVSREQRADLVFSGSYCRQDLA